MCQRGSLAIFENSIGYSPRKHRVVALSHGDTNASHDSQRNLDWIHCDSPLNRIGFSAACRIVRLRSEATSLVDGPGWNGRLRRRPRHLPFGLTQDFTLVTRNGTGAAGMLGGPMCMRGFTS